jgi:hypothetical protein
MNCETCGGESKVDMTDGHVRILCLACGLEEGLCTCPKKEKEKEVDEKDEMKEALFDDWGETSHDAFSCTG